MTRQELFNKVVTGLKAQGYQKSIMDGKCAYRGAEGRKCAAGHLILDEWYSPELEGHGSNAPAIQDALRLSGVSAEDNDLVKRLQLAHDFGGDVARHLREIAARLDLSPEAM